MDEDLPYKDTLVMYCSAEDYIKEGKYAEAVPLLEEVLRLYPGWDYGDGYCHLGSCLWELKDESRGDCKIFCVIRQSQAVSQSRKEPL